MIKCAYKNLLEEGAVSLAAGGEDPAYPLYRLYDRGVGRAFKSAAAQTLEVLCDQGATLFGDDFNDNSIDAAKWNENDTGSNVNEANQRIEGVGNNNWNTNGVRSKNAVAISAGTTWCFSLRPTHFSNYIGHFGVCSKPGFSKYDGTAHSCLVNFGWYAGEFSVDINQTGYTTGYAWQANRTYHIRIAYQAPGWKVYVKSPDDANYATETLIHSTATDSTGPMYFHANFVSSAGLTHLDNVVVYNAAALQAADRLLIPPGHNLAGESLGIKWSHDGVNYFDAVAQWTGAAGLINKSWASKTARYWKFTVANPVSAPQMAELFLTSTHEWERNPSRPAGPLEDVFNVERSQTASGQDRFLAHGAPRRRRPYHMPRCGEAQKEKVLALHSEYGGSAPFWIEDHEGSWIYGRLNAPLALKETAHESYSFDFDFMEVLG